MSLCFASEHDIPHINCHDHALQVGNTQICNKMSKRGLTCFKRRQTVLVIQLYAIKRLPVHKLFFSLKWNCVFPSPYFFQSIPSLLTNNEEAYAECFPGRRTGEGSGSLPLLPPWLRANFRSQSTLKPESVYAYDMFMHS